MSTIDRRRLDQALATIEQAETEATRISADFRRRRDQVAADDWLTDEGRRETIDQARQVAAAEVARLRSVAETARATAAEVAERELAAGIAAADPALTADARARVRQMLDKGTTPLALAEAAADAGDRLTLAALRHELPYLDIDPSLADGVGADAGQDALAALRRVIDDAERQILTGDERVAADALDLLRRLWPGVEARLINAAQLDDGGGLGGTIAELFAGRV